MNSSSAPSISKSFWYCLTSAFFGSVRMLTSVVLVERLERGEHRQAADELGDHAELDQVVAAAPAPSSSPRSLVVSMLRLSLPKPIVLLAEPLAR